jgi:serine/threonine-protein kinase
MMFEATTGQVPFDAATFNQLLFKVVLDEVPRPEMLQPDLDPAFASLISKAMARDLNQRFQSADDFIKAIDGWLQQGKAVTVPPSADARAMSLLHPRTTQGEATAEVKTGTGGTWATSQVDEIPKKKSNLGLMLGIVGVLVVGSAGAVIALGSGSNEPAAPPEAASSNTPSAPTPPVEQQAAPKPPEPSIPPPPEAPASVAPEPAPTVSVAAPVAPTPRPRPTPKTAPPSSKTAAPPTGTAKSKRRDFGY